MPAKIAALKARGKRLIIGSRLPIKPKKLVSKKVIDQTARRVILLVAEGLLVLAPVYPFAFEIHFAKRYSK